LVLPADREPGSDVDNRDAAGEHDEREITPNEMHSFYLVEYRQRWPSWLSLLMSRRLSLSHTAMSDDRFRSAAGLCHL
jgi:hypothetical protein